jgi:hypothetical protein
MQPIHALTMPPQVGVISVFACIDTDLQIRKGGPCQVDVVGGVFGSVGVGCADGVTRSSP